MIEDFNILDVISPALYGRILLARSTKSDKLFVLKELNKTCLENNIRYNKEHMLSNPSTQKDPDPIEDSHKFLYENGYTEIKFSLSLKIQPHESLIDVHDFFWTNKAYYLVYEYYPYGDLYTLIHSAKSGLPLHERRRYLYQIASGIKHIHSLGYAHLDISLENILLSSNGCHICDFGLIQDIDMYGYKPVGKRYYMAPEVYLTGIYETNEKERGIVYAPVLADIWSYGVCFLILIFGFPFFNIPYETDPYFRYISKYGIEKVVLKYNANKNIDIENEELDLIVNLLQINPSKRFRSMDEILNHKYFKSLSQPHEQISNQSVAV